MARGGLMSISMGSVVKGASIRRSDVAEGIKGKGVLIDPNPRATYIAYDQDNKVSVFVDQEAVIKHQLTARTYYIFLIARLNTDMKGNIIGDDLTIEYLKLSDDVYLEFADAYEELMPNVNTVALKKEAKGTYSFVKVTPSKDLASDAVYDKIEGFDLNALWSLVELDLAKSLVQYEAMLAKQPGVSAAPINRREATAIDANASGSADLNPRRRAVQTGEAAQIQARPPRKQNPAPAETAEVEDAEFEEGADEFEEEPAS